MRTSERLRGLKTWTYDNFCKGKEMKAPAAGQDFSKIKKQEPQCYIGWAPSRMDASGRLQEDAASVCPGILIMPNQAYGKYVEEKRFDRYNNIHRPQEMGDHLSVSILFSVFEPGIRLPGFEESVGENGRGMDMSLLLEGTEEGLFTLLNWMDDYRAALLGAKSIPKTDLFLVEESLTYSLYTDQSYVVDRRPIYYGFINAIFACYAEETPGIVESLLN